MLGPLLGRRCALVRHPTAQRVTVQTLAPLTPATADAVTDRAAELLGLPRVVARTRAGSLHARP